MPRIRSFFGLALLSVAVALFAGTGRASAQGGSAQGGSGAGGAFGSAGQTGNTGQGGFSGSSGSSGASGSSSSSSTAGSFTGAGGTASFKSGTFAYTPKPLVTVGSSSSTPSSLDPFASYYISPRSLGMTPAGVTSVQAAKALGQPLFTIATVQTPTASAATATSTGFGFNTIGVPRTGLYITMLDPEFPMPKHPDVQVQAKIVDFLQRSTKLKQQDNIKVAVSGDVVFLRGNVTTARERRLVEAMVRLTPGVRDVENQLLVVETLPSPKKGPS